MQYFIYGLCCVSICLYFRGTSAFSPHAIRGSRFGRAASTTPSSDCRPPSWLGIGAPRVVSTSLAVINKLDPERPSMFRWEIVGMSAVLLLLAVSLAMQLAQGQMLATQGQVLTTLSSKFDQIGFFFIGCFALATFGSSVANIVKLLRDIEKEKKEDTVKRG